jgi:hypothetical protein
LSDIQKEKFRKGCIQMIQDSDERCTIEDLSPTAGILLKWIIKYENPPLYRIEL